MLLKALFSAMLATTALAGNAYMPSLPDEVMADLARRDPSEYQTFKLRDEEEIQKRGPPNGLTGIKTRGTASRSYAFTFDDGPYTHMKDITDHAVENGFKVTFFVNVDNYSCIYSKENVSRLRYAYAKGMQICSHTATHPHLNTLSHSQIDTEVARTETALYKILGVVPSCIRPPYGEANEDVVNYLNNRHNLVVVNWNYDSGDSVGASVADSKKTLRGIKAPKHAIVLMHETVETTPNELFPDAITIAKNNGYASKDFMTVSAALKFNGYKVVGQRGSRDSTWTC